MKRLFVLLVLFFLTPGFGKLLENDVSKASFKSFSFKESCLVMGHKETPLIEAHGATHIDCMGTLVKATDVCQKQLADKRILLRGIVDSEKGQILCQQGERVILGLLCDKDHEKYCGEPQAGCKKLKDTFAFSLELVHHSLVAVSEGKKLNCYFEARPSTVEKELEKILVD